jgi:putative membrane protein
MNSEDKRDTLQQYLANERTFLAWIRACIALIGLGFIISKFNILLGELRSTLSQNPSFLQNQQDHFLYLENFRFESFLGSGLIFLAVIFILIALWNYQRITRSLETGIIYTNPILVYLIASIVIIVSFLTIAYLTIVNL